MDIGWYVGFAEKCLEITKMMGLDSSKETPLLLRVTDWRGQAQDQADETTNY